MHAAATKEMYQLYTLFESVNPILSTLKLVVFLLRKM